MVCGRKPEITNCFDCVFVLGAAIAAVHKNQLPNIEIERESFVTIAGYVQSIEHRIAAPLRLRITVMEASKLPELAGEDIQITVRTDYPDTLATGHAVQLTAILEPQSGPMVPGGFDFALNHRLKGIALRVLQYHQSIFTRHCRTTAVFSHDLPTIETIF